MTSEPLFCTCGHPPLMHQENLCMPCDRICDEPLINSEWLHSVGLTLEVECTQCGAVFESPDPNKLDNWARSHACNA